MKITYIIIMSIEFILMLAGAILIPVYITPGYYWWSALLLLLIFAQGEAFGDRLDKWEKK